MIDRKWRSILLSLLLSLVLLLSSTSLISPAFANNGSSTQKPNYPALVDGNFWVDTTNSVDLETLNALNIKSKEIQENGYQIGGFIFNDSPEDMLEIATNFGNINGIGYRGRDNGVSIAIALDRKSTSGISPSIGIAIGSGIEGLLNDGKVGRILDQLFVPQRQQGNWKQGLLLTVDAIKGELSGENKYEDPFIIWFNSLPLWGQILFIIICLILLFFIAANSDSSGSSSGSSSESSSTPSGRGGGFGGGGAGR